VNIVDCRQNMDSHMPTSPTDTIDRDALISACQAIIRIPSETGEEAEVAAALVAVMNELGYDEAYTDANGNVIGRIEGIADAPSVMLNGHIDHVPAGDMVDPFSGDLVDAARWGGEGQAIYGRGTCDMKCNVVAATFAAAAVKKAGHTGGDIIVVADVEEEIDSPKGVQSVIEDGLTADYGINVEATNGGVYLGHRGKLEFMLTVRGRTSHASEPSNGINAISEAMKYVAAYEAYAQTLPDDDLMGPATAVAVGMHSAPDNGTALVPDRCHIRLDRRYVRGETPESCETEIREVMSKVSPALDEPWTLELFNHYPLMFTDRDNPVVKAAINAMTQVHDETPRVSAWRFGVNGTFMAAAGIPTVGLGPGDEIWAHTPEEHILVEDLVSTTQALALAIAEITNTKATT
jgi:putative selenium metabolism hydrolase